MISARIEGGLLHIHTENIPAEDGGDDFAVIDVIELGSIPIYAELLGMTDAIDVVDAMIHKASTEREAEEVESGLSPENDWTEIYRVKEHLEKVRRDEAVKAMQEGRADDPRSPRLRAAMRVRAELLSMTGCESSGDSLLAKCQNAVRQRLGIPSPERPVVSAVRDASITCEETPCTVDEPGCGRELCDEDRKALRGLLEPCQPWFKQVRSRFNHMLTGATDDPFSDEYEQPERKREPVTFESVLNRYGTKAIS